MSLYLLARARNIEASFPFHFFHTSSTSLISPVRSNTEKLYIWFIWYPLGFIAKWANGHNPCRIVMMVELDLTNGLPLFMLNKHMSIERFEDPTFWLPQVHERATFELTPVNSCAHKRLQEKERTNCSHMFSRLCCPAFLGWISCRTTSISFHSHLAPLPSARTGRPPPGLCCSPCTLIPGSCRSPYSAQMEQPMPNRPNAKLVSICSNPTIKQKHNASNHNCGKLWKTSDSLLHQDSKGSNLSLFSESNWFSS